MRTASPSLTRLARFARFGVLALLAALALAQGRQTREGLRKNGHAGPGFVQQEFLLDLEERLADEVGARRARAMLERLRGAGLTKSNVFDLLHGRGLTKSDMRKQLGANSGELDDIAKALDRAVLDKERKIFFGALVATMAELDVDPSSDFCKQVGLTCGRLEDDDFRKLKAGNVSKALIRESFLLRSEADKEAMQDYLNRTRSSPLLEHPLYTGKTGGYDPKRFGKLEDGMPGTGKDFEDGLAGGLPFDAELPPCPFYGRNLETYFRD